MDPLTHVLSGAALANAGPRQRWGTPAVWVMAVAAELPDVDQLLMFSGDPFYITARRTLTHSAFGIPLVAAACAWLFRRFFFPHIPFRPLFLMSLAGCVLHSSLDVINSFGVALFYPLSAHRYELASVFIIDLAVTGILAAPLLLAFVPALRGRQALLARLSLSALVLYIGFCQSARLAAAALLRKEAVSAVAAPSFDYVFPEPFGPQRFRGVLREGGEYHVYLIRPVDGTLERSLSVRTYDHLPALREVRASPEGKRLDWFFKAPVWEWDAAKGEAIGWDLRFHSLVFPRGNPFTARLKWQDGRVTEAGWAPGSFTKPLD